MANQGTIKLGSWGGSGGNAWNWNPGSDSSIIEIVIRSGDVVSSLAFTSFNSTTGQETHSATHGGNDGESHTIVIKRSEGEYLSLISGTTRTYQERNIVGSLTFHTNKNNYGPYGIASVGTAFKIPMENGKIVGFFGRAGWWIDALGIYVIPAN